MRRAITFLVALVLLLGVSACGGGEEVAPLPETVEGTIPAETGEAGGDGEETETGETEAGEDGAAGGTAQAGKEIFASAGCGGCHTLADAGTSGTVGPNLDESQPSQDEAAEVIANGRGGMPAFKDQLSEEEIQNVAAYVSEVAGS